MSYNSLNNQYPQNYIAQQQAASNPYQQAQYPVQGPNAVNINIVQPQAYGTSPASTNSGVVQQQPQQGLYPYNSLYGQPQGMPNYPPNYNNMLNSQAPADNERSAVGNGNMAQKTDNPEENKKIEGKKDEKPKTVTPLTDDYVKSLENYLNNDNSKVRLIGAKELVERLKEDENRKDNKSLIPLVNKTLRDSSPSVRFLGLTALQLGYCTGNDETVQILKEIQSQNKDKFGQDSLLASEILLKMAAPQGEVKEQ